MSGGSIRVKLEDAGRLIDVIDVLVDNFSMDFDRCIGMSNDYLVKAKDLRVETTNFIRDIIHGKIFMEIPEYENLQRFMTDRCDNALHNYANHLTHRLPADEKELDRIRVYSIISNLLTVIQSRENGDEVVDWDVPNGWEAITND